MFSVDIKALSINEGYKGRKFKTSVHKLFKDRMDIALRKMDLPKLRPKEDFFINYIFYTSTNSDVDNLIKLTQDAICEKLGIDDRYLSGLHARKVKVKKGQERIKFDIFQNEYDQLQAIQNMREDL